MWCETCTLRMSGPLLQTVPCLAYSSRLDAQSGWHGDDFYTEGEAETLDEVDMMNLGDLQSQSASTVGTRCERGGYDPETRPQVVNGRCSPDARCEACGESGESPRGQGCEVKSNTLFTCHWSRPEGRAGAVDSFGSDSVPARHRNCSVPSSHKTCKRQARFR